MNIKPLYDRVLLKPIVEPEKTKGGIFIPDSAKKKPQQAEVVAVGPGTDKKKVTVKIGDVVLYEKYGGTEIDFDNESYLMIKAEEILAVITK